MYSNKDLKKIKADLLRDKNLGDILPRITSFFQTDTLTSLKEQLEDIKNDYGLMLDYMSRGFQDPKRQNVYDTLLIRTDRLLNNCLLKLTVSNVSIYNQLSFTVSSFDTDHDHIKGMLENFVTDIAMLGLEPEKEQVEKAKSIYAEHQLYMDQFFNTILLSQQWTDSDYAFYRDLLISPTIDTNDAQLIVSAIMVSCLNIFDYYKFVTLLKVSTSICQDRSVRQRALVGWTLSLPSERTLYDQNILKEVTPCLSDHKYEDEVIELQKQIFFCMDVDRDNAKIQNEIIPNITQANHFNITKFGISEKEEDSLNEILHPEHDEDAMEKAEQSFHKMMDMQKSGSDVFFSGFSMMKHFTFFYTLSNWFVPFYIEHPGLVHAMGNLEGKNIVKQILDVNPFCSSDKYSFVLALSSIINQAPADIREALSSGTAIQSNFSRDDQDSSSFIRRAYLQDIYRFYRLYSGNTDFCNPFEANGAGKGHFFFVESGILSRAEDVEKRYIELGSFLYKHNAYQNASQMLDRVKTDTFSIEEKYKYYILSGAVDMKLNYPFAKEKFENAIALRPNSERALFQLARISFLEEDYDMSLEYYRRLVELCPENRRYSLSYSLVEIKHYSFEKKDSYMLEDNNTEAKELEEAVQRLYKLNFDDPHDNSVKRVLAWGLLFQGKSEPAEHFYNELIQGDDGFSEDRLNKGYCLWVSGKVVEAVECFKNFIVDRAVKGSIFTSFLYDVEMLHANHICDADIRLMSDLVDKRN